MEIKASGLFILSLDFPDDGHGQGVGSHLFGDTRIGSIVFSLGIGFEF